jgi:hypothetical protein
MAIITDHYFPVISLEANSPIITVGANVLAEVIVGDIELSGFGWHNSGVKSFTISRRQSHTLF